MEHPGAYMKVIPKLTGPAMKSRTPHVNELESSIKKTGLLLSRKNDQLSEDGDDSKDEEDSEDDLSETGDDGLCESIGFATASLAELRPSIEQNLLSSERSRLQSAHPTFGPFHLSTPASIYVSIVRDKFPKAQDQLIERLGEANWQRHISVRKQVGANEKPLEEQEVGSIFHPHSAFHDSGIGTSVQTQTQYAESHTSFISSNTEGAKGALRVPPMPANACSGQSFQCPVCKLIVSNIQNRVEWK